MQNRLMLFACIIVIAGYLTAPLAHAKDTSGPSVGERITNFTVKGTLDDERGKDLDLVQQAGGKTLVLFFLHERSRPAIALARQVLSAAADLRSQGVTAGLVVLSPDVAATDEWVNVARDVFPRGVTIAVSPDGPLGPAAYNLSSKVVVTVLVVHNNRVTANFALNQPTPDDAAPMIEAIKDALAAAGGKK
jgi:hypothetical protein